MSGLRPSPPAEGWTSEANGLLVPGFRRDNVDADPPHDFPDYQSTRLRAPTRPLTHLPHGLTEVTGPLLGEGLVGEWDHDLTRQHASEPLGERILISGRIVDGDGRGIPHTLVEIWQANASGRYVHAGDRHPAPLDPNFTGVGRCMTDVDGNYHFVTVRPGAYPWRNHHNAWRPAHVHFSLFGRAFAQRIITQMYFPNDPLFDQDPIFHSVRDASARERLIARFDLETTEPEWALSFKWDIVLRGREATPIEDEGGHS
jgi:protocatechuate 3,4-dioxygenase, beta subunit